MPGIDEHIRFLVIQNIASYLFPETGRVAIHVQPIVLQLERQPQRLAETVDTIRIRLARSAYNRPYLQRSSQQHGCFQANHLDIFRFGHIVPTLEFHIVLLTLANFKSRFQEQLDDSPRVRSFRAGDITESDDLHGIARKYGRILVPHLMHRRFTTAHVGFVHHIVMQQRKVVKHFQPHRRIQCPTIIARKHLAGKQRQQRPHALTAQRQLITHGSIQSIGFGGIFYLRKFSFYRIEISLQFFHKLLENFYVLHRTEFKINDFHRAEQT